ncbi:MAG: Pleiotropic regulator 1, partial [Cercozoa sp. M6MM]
MVSPSAALQRHALETSVFFASDYDQVPKPSAASVRARVLEQARFGHVREREAAVRATKRETALIEAAKSAQRLALPAPETATAAATPSEAPAVAAAEEPGTMDGESVALINLPVDPLSGKMRARDAEKPRWHAPWRIRSVLAGHQGWVRCVDVDVSNEWFATGAADRTVKFWDLASGQLKMTFVGHTHTVRAVKVSTKRPYLFSAGEDKKVICWDLETNQCARTYHGHLSGVYALGVHPDLDIIATGGRDAAVHVWDVRQRKQIYTLTGHRGDVLSILMQSTEPQLVSGAADAHVRLWDLRKGKTRTVLTHHKKSVRALAWNPQEYTFASASTDNVKVWQCPDGVFLRNVNMPIGVKNALAINDDGVMAVGTDVGKLRLFDWSTGYMFQEADSPPQPGSLASEASILAACFDRTVPLL